MIRAEIVVKDRYGYQSSSLEREIKLRLIEAALLTAQNASADITRIQFLGPKKAS